MQHHGSEKRREVRVFSNERVAFVAAQATREMECQGVVINMSTSGMRLYHYCSLKEGDEIRLITALSDTCGKGVVRWVRRVDDISGLAGVACCEA